MASTVTSEVMAVPALVMKAFDPSMTHSTRLPIRLHSRGRGAHAAGDVRPAAGLGQPERGQPLARAQVGQPPAPLLLGAEPVDRHGAQRHRRLQRDGHRGVDPGEFLQREAEREQVAPHAAVLLRERQAEQAELGHPGHDLVGEFPPLVVVADHRCHHVAGEFGDGRLEFLVVVLKPEADHGCPPQDRCSGRRRPAPDGLRETGPDAL